MKQQAGLFAIALAIVFAAVVYGVVNRNTFYPEHEMAVPTVFDHVTGQWHH